MRRPLLISGFMATGKSTVGRLVADQTGNAFLDLDQVIEQRSGATIPELFSRRGEPEFRRIEREILASLLQEHAHAPIVISLGGGALLDRPFRVETLGRAVVVSLSAHPEEIARRALAQDGQSGARPLLAEGDPAPRILALLAAREDAYRECHAQIATDELTPEQVARDAMVHWKRDAVAVAAGASSYAVQIGSELIESELGQLVGQPSGTLLVSDETVFGLHGAKAQAGLSHAADRSATAILTPGEEHKSLAGLAGIYEEAFAASLDRKAVFVGLGGGVVTDMTGFAAATWVRGVRWVGLPTTLLSMVDASTGGKTAVDFKTAKNSVGAFWQPSGVICDISTLKTETDRMYIGALSEVVKTALIGDPELFELLEDRAEAVKSREPEVVREMVDRCVRVKARVVSLDERELGLRATLNLGHTIGHALESSGGYTALTHGEAVSLGLVAALRFGIKKGRTSEALSQRTLRLLQALGLPHELSRDALTRACGLIGHDKKRAGSEVRFVFAQDVGKVTTAHVDLAELTEITPDLADH